MQVMTCRHTSTFTARTVGLVLLVLAASLGCKRDEPPQSQVGPVTAYPESNRALRILYAGRPGSDREKDFVAFLQWNFDTVRTGDLRTFTEADAQDFDVTLLDWDKNDPDISAPTVSEGFSRPVITLGVPGGLIAKQWRLKTGYL
ncbi:MAG: hypothetical protein ABFE01_08675 [Phycisphaerales bacterium]|jgi:hypothetical protein